MTSAAMPDFQAKPKLVSAALINAGNMSGNLILKNILVGVSLKTLPISIYFLSILKSAVSVEDQIIGNTIKKVIKIGKLVLLNQKKARIIKDATGTAFTSCTMGAVISLKSELLADNIPHKNPEITPNEKPQIIRKSETATDK